MGDWGQAFQDEWEFYYGPPSATEQLHHASCAALPAAPLRKVGQVHGR